MKILLIGNYSKDQQFSMQKFTDCLEQHFNGQGHEVKVCQPQTFFASGFSSTVSGAGKWLGYLDKYLLFPLNLKKLATWADVIHICDHSNAIYVPYIKNRPHLVTCHDLMAVRSALDEFNQYNRVSGSGRLQQHWILKSLKQADRIAAVSQATKDDLLRLTGKRNVRVDVVYNGLNYPFRRLEKPVALSLLKDKGIKENTRFLLHVGGNQWYKNRKGLLGIFSKICRLQPDKDLKLVLAGKPLAEEHIALIKKYELQDKVVPITDLSTEQICALYSLCEAFVFPSLCEGFGWPVIEAQACDALVFTSNRPPLTEVGGAAAIYIDPDDHAQSAITILKVLDRPESIRQTKKAIVGHLGQFTTESMISGYLDLYQSISANGRSSHETVTRNSLG